MMKVPPVLLLAVALWARQAWSLECYVCNVSTYRGCQEIVNCSSTERFCTRYAAISTTIGYSMLQGCAAVCPIGKAFPEFYTLTCCQENRCNGAGGIQGCTSLLAASLFMSFTPALTLTGL
ncbi:weak toxin 2-like [Hemicordylus capensis]|uniref:weak toxin 2-like n=1 Tax=Hemicordylus capensis TaxID=884348 RepID=UPI0023042120|nr:weak toxin 2-like [Hemicordylus capensis]